MYIPAIKPVTHEEICTCLRSIVPIVNRLEQLQHVGQVTVCM